MESEERGRTRGSGRGTSTRGTQETFVVRVKRVCHTKAGGRVWSYQVVALASDGHGNLGWAKAGGDHVFKAKSKALKGAQKRMKRMAFDRTKMTFFRDARLKMGKGRFLILKRQKEGMGLTASPILSKVLQMIGIENACVRTVNGPDILTVLNSLSFFLLDRQ